MAKETKDTKSAGSSRCPICGAKMEQAYRPFCSAHCRDVDLARWLGDGYAIPGGHEAADEDGEDAGAGSGRPVRHDDDDDPA
jgi:endogenous inhibitor of DNA gyrase (YacG/DUF329 family)